MNIFKSLGGGQKKNREATGPLTGRLISLGDKTIKAEAVIGEGGFATIYRAVDPDTQAIYALKHFVLSGDLEAERDVQTEVAVMRALSSCPNVLKLQGAAMGSGAAFLLLDYCTGTLAGYMAERGSNVTDEQVVAIFLSVAHAVATLHALDPPMTHRDIKAENILYNRERNAWVLCDFGSSTSEQKVYASSAEIAREEERIRKNTTPAYRAPELWDLYDRKLISAAVDVWSLGCLLYFIAYGGRLPFDGDQKLQILNGKYSTSGMEGVKRPQIIETLIAEMLVVEPEKRISAREVVDRLSSFDASRSRHSGGGRSSRSGTREQPPRAGPMAAAALATTTTTPELATATATTTNDVWGQEFDAVAASTPASLHTETAPTMTRSVSNGKESTGGGWADFESISTETTTTSAQTPTTIARMASSTSSVHAQIPGGATYMNSNTTASSPSPSVNNVKTTAARSPYPGLSEVGSHHSSQFQQQGEARGSSGAAISSTSGTTILPPPTATAAALSNKFEGLHVGASELQEHCQVLEQVLEERGKEVALLHRQLKEVKEESRVWRARAEQAEREVALWKKKDSISSFPVAGGTPGGEGPSQDQTSMTMTGARRASSRGGGGVSESGDGVGRQNSFFSDLNPLSGSGR